MLGVLLAAITTAPVTTDNGALRVFNIRLVGISTHSAHKLLATVIFILLVVALRYALRGLASLVLGGERLKRGRFWTRQGINLFLAIVMVIGITSIWFDDPTHLATALGLVTAGLAFALQKVVTSVAGYFVILRGNTFTVGDRISMGGVRGDVIALGFIQTTIMEMGQPPAVQSADPAMWVKSRQFTGRIVTVSNSAIFDTPIFNYTRDFPFIFEEMTLPIAYHDDRAKAEQILLDAAQEHVVDINELTHEARHHLNEKYGVLASDFQPRVYMRLTDNWVELTVRFITRDHRIRDVKDKMSRKVIDALDAAKIGVASATFDIVGLPPVTIKRG